MRWWGQYFRWWSKVDRRDSLASPSNQYASNQIFVLAYANRLASDMLRYAYPGSAVPWPCLAAAPAWLLPRMSQYFCWIPCLLQLSYIWKTKNIIKKGHAFVRIIYKWNYKSYKMAQLMDQLSLSVTCVSTLSLNRLQLCDTTIISSDLCWLRTVMQQVFEHSEVLTETGVSQAVHKAGSTAC